MRVVIAPLTCLSLVITIAPLLAAENKKSEEQMDYQARMEVYQKLAAPGEPHKLLTSQAGSWTTKTKSWMEPDKPPMESTGNCEDKVLLGGRFLQQECTGELMGQPYTGIGTHGYDNLTKKYLTTWMDSMGTAIFFMDGTASADGKTITLYGSHRDPMGGIMTHRAVWKFIDQNTQTFEMYGREKDGNEMKMMEITYTRNS
jgi:uncharacterized protein DUF1579